MKIVATYTDSVQATEDTWRLKSISNIFDEDQTFGEVFAWVESQIRGKTDLSALKFTEVIK